jgi:hypothetical protein
MWTYRASSTAQAFFIMMHLPHEQSVRPLMFEWALATLVAVLYKTPSAKSAPQQSLICTLNTYYNSTKYCDDTHLHCIVVGRVGALHAT